MVRRSWFQLLLFWLTLAAAVALAVLVFLAPLLDNGGGRSRWLAVFARDQALRRTALASALCLAVTACVFFRPPGRTRPRPRKTLRAPRRPPPGGFAGA